MLAYIIRRLASTVLVMGIVAVFVFLRLHLSPGDPAAIIAGDNATGEQIDAIRRQLGLDDALVVQFYRWLVAVLHGDLGISIFSNEPVAKLIGQRIEPPFSLALTTLVVAVTLAVSFGVLAAWKVGSWIDRSLMVVSVLGFSVPVFVVGYMLIYVFSINLRWLPVQGYSPIDQGFGPWIERLILPSIALGLAYVALIARITRTSMLEVLAEDYIRTANAKGVATRSVLLKHALKNAGVAIGTILAIITALAFLAPLFAGDAITMQPALRLRPPSETNWFGTDHLGRDVFARTVYGAQVSLFVGISVAAMSIAGGLFIGLMSGYFRRVDAVVMRLMDGLMAIPAILLAIALVALTRASVTAVIVAITIPEIPRVVRLVRAVVLSVREAPYVEAAIAGGTPTWKILLRHILPNTIAPLIVQATYICASAILIEAALSFLGAGTPPEIPTWGNMIAQSRLFLSRAPWTIFCPGIALALVVLAVNLLGDGLRDRLDPRLARRM